MNITKLLGLIDPGTLLAIMLDEDRYPWRKRVEIVPEYMPPNPDKDTRPRCVVRYTGGEEEGFLRYSKGPKQGHFWDLYGDDYVTPERALLAILDCPPPPQRYSMTFELPLRHAEQRSTSREGG